MIITVILISTEIAVSGSTLCSALYFRPTAEAPWLKSQQETQIPGRFYQEGRLMLNK